MTPHFKVVCEHPSTYDLMVMEFPLYIMFMPFSAMVVIMLCPLMQPIYMLGLEMVHIMLRREHNNVQTYYIA